jgi:DNA repair exonuclease SbcCD nuclease subunit
MRGLVHYDGAPTEAVRSATRTAFENLVDFAVERKVHLVAIAGDLYDGSWRDYNTGLFIVKGLVRLHEEGIRVVLLYGNHDAESKITNKLRLPPNTKDFGSGSPQTHVLDDLGVAVHGQSYPSPHVTDDIAAAYPQARSGVANIGMLHTCYDGTLGHAQYAPCKADDLRSKGYDYWALGHIHKRQVLSEDPFVVFPGNLQGRDVGETGPKGATLVTFDDGVVTLDPVVLDAVRWARCEVDVTGAAFDDCLDLCRNALLDLAKGGSDTYAVRVVLTGPTEADGILRSKHEHLTAEIRSIGIEVGAADLWIEKVALSTVPPAGVDSLVGEGLAGEIGQVLLDVKTRLPGLLQVGDGELDSIGKLRAKLRAAVPEVEGVLDDDALASALDDAAQILVTRLGDGGVTDAD